MKKFFHKYKSQIINYSVLTLGAVACCFCRFTFNMWFMAFIFLPSFIFYIRRETKLYLGLPLLFCACFLGCSVSLFKFSIASGIGIQLALNLVVSLLLYIPFVLDKLVYTRFFSKHPFVLSFLLPLTIVTIDVILGFTPFGNYTSIAYSLCQILNAATILSLFGINFLTLFIVYISYMVSQLFINFKANIKTLITGCSTLLFVLGYSTIYSLVPISNNISITIMSGYSTNDSNGYDRTYRDLDYNKNWINIDIDKLNKASKKVDMLVYPEEAFMIKQSDEQVFRQYLSATSTNNNIYVIAGVCVTNDNKDKNIKNSAIICSPDGTIQEYIKTHLVPLDEQMEVVGNGDIKYIDIPNKGKVAVVICMDLEFPTYISKAARAKANALIAPSWDWHGMPSNHSQYNCYRAIENGINFFRCTEIGTSIVCDYKGNILNQYYSDTWDNKKQNHENYVFDLPMSSRTTIYSYIAPGIDFVYPIALVSLITVFAIKDNKKTKK